jgi:hypothetical protein
MARLGSCSSGPFDAVTVFVFRPILVFVPVCCVISGAGEQSWRALEIAETEEVDWPVVGQGSKYSISQSLATHRTRC